MRQDHAAGFTNEQRALLGQPVPLGSCKSVIPPESEIRISCLCSAPQTEAVWGAALSLDPTAARWIVRLEPSAVNPHVAQRAAAEIENLSPSIKRTNRSSAEPEIPIMRFLGKDFIFVCQGYHNAVTEKPPYSRDANEVRKSVLLMFATLKKIDQRL